MSIVFGGDAGVREDALTSIGSKMKNDISDWANGMGNMFTQTSFTASPAMPTSEPVHIDNGFSNVPGTSFLGSGVDSIDDIKQRNIITQEPMLTVYIKKRAFWSLKNENSIRYMDRGEKLFLRATKKLFERKCAQIASYEAMTKVNGLISDEAELDYDTANVIADYLLVVANGSAAEAEAMEKVINNGGITIEGDNATAAQVNIEFAELAKKAKEDSEKLMNIVDGFRELGAMNASLKHATHTQWVIHPNQPDIFQTGAGAGVIELTLVTNLNTNLRLDGTSSISFEMEDPYNLTKISSEDVEMALSSAIAEIDILTRVEGASLRGPQYYLEEAKRKDNLLQRSRKDHTSRLLGLDSDYFTSSSGNTVLGTTDLPSVLFEVNPTSSATSKNAEKTASKVVAYIEGTTYKFISKGDLYAVVSSLPVEQQFTMSEIKLIEDIFNLLERYVEGVEALNTNTRETNKKPDVRHARSNLRKHYLGKSIVQPMDGVHVYARGKTIRTHAFDGPLSTLLNNSTFIQNYSNDRTVSYSMLEEEMRALKIEDLGIPAEMYESVRTSSFLRNAGTHIFGGVISEVSESYNADSGKYMTRAIGASNMRWLQISRLNKIPSLDQTEGLVLDPLTEFDIDVDPATGLVKKISLINETTQDRIDDKSLRINKGPNAGAVYSDRGDRQNHVFDKVDINNDIINQYRHVPGKAYKWKNGIIVSTLNTNWRRSLTTTENDTSRMSRYIGATIVKDPFAGQDAADIVSIIVTGCPHNYETFFENAQSIGTFTVPSDNSGLTYFSSLFDIIRTQNKSLGNFQPIKLVNQDRQATHERLNTQNSLYTGSKNIEALRQKLAELQGQRSDLEMSSIFGEDDQGKKQLLLSLNEIISSIKKKISDQESAWQKSIKDAERLGLRVVGNDVAFDVSIKEHDDVKKEISNLRLRNTLMQFRSQYDCKFNHDSNYFIIGDEYDKDIDLQAFVLQSTQESNMYNSEYQYPGEICSATAKSIDFEFYCDTQGHIQFRPPRYNKVPLSLILKMLFIDDRENIKLYSEFLSLNSLFKTRKDSYEENKKSLNLSIRESTLLLGGNVDVYKEGFGRVVIDSIDDISVNGSEDLVINVDYYIDSIIDEIIAVRNEMAATLNGKSYDERDKLSIRAEIRSLNDPRYPNMYANRLAEKNRLSKLISEEQKVSEILEKLNAKGKQYSGQKDLPLDSNKEDILSPYTDMIEDDYNDYLGYGSSKRFIIRDDQILSYTFSESDRNIETHVEVNGQVDFLGDAPGEIGRTPVLRAYGTDFDMWRQYGFRHNGAVTKPFLKNAESQCAPYATMLLSRYRKNIVTGNITVIGNEFYQLGDVVYVNSRDMLYYVSGLEHSFSYSGTFTTTLSLTYGHSLGEYIPTPFDVIGKTILSNQKVFNRTFSYRETASKIYGVHICCVKFPVEKSKDDDEYRAMLSGNFGMWNVGELKKGLITANMHIGDDKEDSWPKVEIRGFITKEENRDLVKARMVAVAEWFKRVDGWAFDNGSGYVKLSIERYVNKALRTKQFSSNEEPVLINKDKPSVEEIARYPREEVYSMADTDTSSVDSVIEVVLLFEPISEARILGI